MRESHQRMLPRQRVEAAAAAVAAVTQQRLRRRQTVTALAVDDLTDPLLSSGPPAHLHPPDYLTTWRALWRGCMPGHLRIFGWSAASWRTAGGRLQDGLRQKLDTCGSCRSACAQHPDCTAAPPAEHVLESGCLMCSCLVLWPCVHGGGCVVYGRGWFLEQHPCL